MLIATIIRVTVVSMTELDIPEAMRRVIAFVNTIDVEARTDAIATPDDLAAWSQEQGLLAAGETVSAEDVRAARDLREALRAALVAHDEHDATAADGAALATVPLHLTIRGDGSVDLVAAGSGRSPVLGRLAAAIPAAMADGTWWRTKVCPRDDCLWAFYDRSRNRSRRWCSMEVCGNREKTRTFRERQRD